MKFSHLAIVVLSLALVGCGKYSETLDLDRTSFGADTIKLIEDDCGLSMPAGSKGLAFHYKPPIDPYYFAKLEVPESSKAALQAQIERFTNSTSFPGGFLDCTWWPRSFEGALSSRQAAVTNSGGTFYLELYLMREDGRLILYLKYFTS